MKRFLPIVLLAVLSTLAAGQRVTQQKKPPKPSDFPKVSANCVNKQKLEVEPVAGVAVEFAKTVKCVFTIYRCNTWSTHESNPRPQKQDACADWVAENQLLRDASIEVCCDPEAASGPIPEPDTEAKCDPPAPWFDDSSGCSQRQQPQVTIQQSTIIASMCGYEIFRRTSVNNTAAEVRQTAVFIRSKLQSTIGDTICCNKFNEVVRTGVPCNPSVDIDCDGRSNQEDVLIGNSAPDINMYTERTGAPIDTMPFGLNPNDEEFRPERAAREATNVGDCPCKWELIKGELKCSPDRRQPHVYVATWKCPTTKAEVFTTKRAPATAACYPPGQ